METILDLLQSGKVYTREELAAITEKDDRTVRREIRELRRDGFPIKGMQGGGYKLAVTDQEKQEALHQFKGRALDMLKTYSNMRKAMQIDGQMDVLELSEAVMNL